MTRLKLPRGETDSAKLYLMPDSAGLSCGVL